MVDYRNKLILAPMVRVSTLPFRLLSLEYGADLVYCEEIIDFKIMNCKRIYNEVLDTIDFCVDGIPKPVFRTCKHEQGKVIFQLGTADAERALKVCKLIENDVAGVDLNMGCPKEFSIQGGMGAALLKKPEKIKEIVTTLTKNCKIPITCKIRILHSLEDTIELCKLIESCGAAAITVHGRFQEERPRHANHNDYIREIVKHIKIPIIANGGSNIIKKHEDIEEFRKDCGVTSVMLARVAMHNCSIFRKEGMLPSNDVMKRYLQICMDYDNFFFNTKYTIQQMMYQELDSERGVKLLSSEIGEEIYVLFDMLDVYKSWKVDFDKRMHEYIVKQMKENTVEETTNGKIKLDDRDTNEDEEANNKKLKTDETKTVILPLKYIKKEFENITVSPKSVLHQYTRDNEMPKPIYRTEEKKPERIYRCVLELNGVFYQTPFWEPNKQLTEQAVAMVCLETLGVNYKINSLKKKSE